jgi:hypothetical protein
MTSGRWIVVAIIAITAVFGAVMWYAQTRAYYETAALELLPVTLADGSTITLNLDAARSIDADTSPLRFRACFNVDADVAARLVTAGTPAEDAAPLVAPGWFDCYDARVIGAALASGQAQAVLATHEIARGVDRVIAIFPDGSGFAWHQLNGTLED